MKISIVDYGVGNIFSIGQALKSLGLEFTLDVDGASVLQSDVVIVPGVAAFGIGMKNLEERGQAEELRNFYRTGKPLIGLCLGAQMFLKSSSESHTTQGFGFVEGTVAMLNKKMCRVPQQGWSKLMAPTSSTFSEFDQEFFYFSHSYKMNLSSMTTSVYSSQHDREVITAFFIDKNVLGVQFHPERSGPKGLRFLETAILSANIWA